jgi:hypothetical protein
MLPRQPRERQGSLMKILNYRTSNIMKRSSLREEQYMEGSKQTITTQLRKNNKEGKGKGKGKREGEGCAADADADTDADADDAAADDDGSMTMSSRLKHLLLSLGATSPQEVHYYSRLYSYVLHCDPLQYTVPPDAEESALHYIILHYSILHYNILYYTNM